MKPQTIPTPATPLLQPRRRLGLIIVGLIAIGLVAGFVPRWLARRQLQTETHAESVLTVNVISPVPAKSSLGTPLPAEVQAFVQASIHARASGYLKIWYADIGDRVTNGQALAEIDTPELDQQLAQARAELDQARASLGLAKITADRWTELLKTASVSEQETAEKVADYALKQANLAAATANLQRLEDLKRFDLVTAPFAGAITARNTDIGQLITAGSGPELFRMAQTDPLRIYVRVPQTLVPSLESGQKAELTFTERPGRVFTAAITRTAGAVDPVSRTVQVELQLPNAQGEILAGSYAQVRFKQAAAADVLMLSNNGLIFRSEGMQAAVVDASGRVTLRSLKLGRDFGSTVEVLDGLTVNDRIINNPPDFIADGMTVQVAPER